MSKLLGNEAILILDFGAQYSQLIARRVRDLNVFCEIKSYQISADEIAKKGYKGIIFPVDQTVFMLRRPFVAIRTYFPWESRSSVFATALN